MVYGENSITPRRLAAPTATRREGLASMRQPRPEYHGFPKSQVGLCCAMASVQSLLPTNLIVQCAGEVQLGTGKPRLRRRVITTPQPQLLHLCIPSCAEAIISAA